MFFGLVLVPSRHPSNSSTINQIETIQKYFPPTLPAANFPPGRRTPKTAPIETGLKDARPGHISPFLATEETECFTEALPTKRYLR
jgi:hypothetical protein